MFEEFHVVIEERTLRSRFILRSDWFLKEEEEMTSFNSEDKFIQDLDFDNCDEDTVLQMLKDFQPNKELSQDALETLCDEAIAHDCREIMSWIIKNPKFDFNTRYVYHALRRGKSEIFRILMKHPNSEYDLKTFIECALAFMDDC